MTNTIRKLRFYRKKGFKFDFVAAIVVFLVAVPLCLGIALASGVPLFSGIISGVVGGIVVGTLSGSHVSVSGPAAGMAAVVVTAIAQLGDFPTFLLALLFAGLLQIVVGSLRAGFIADYIPSNVIQGLLCAIGILLVVKQLPFALSHSATLPELKINLLDMTKGFSMEPLYDLSHHINAGAVILSVVSFIILIYIPKTRVRWLKAIPGPIVVVMAGIVLNELFVLTDSYLVQNSPQLVNIPEHNGLFDLFSQVASPAWNAWANPKVYLYALILALVASLESLLNVNAGEKLDKKRHCASKDQELIAQGAGNMVAALIGGIPVTSVIVRTSVNIQAGAKTKFATILHGLFLFLAVLLIPSALNKIPLSSLAAILIYTGFKLTQPSIYVASFRQGWYYFIPFMTTIICIVWLNLLVGILTGLLVGLFYILRLNSQARIDIIKEIYPNGIANRLILPQHTTFLNKASLIAELRTIPKILNSSLTHDIQNMSIERS